MAFSTQFERVLTAAFLVLALAAGAGAFAVGFTGALTHNLADPASAPALRLTALSRLEESLGYGGFLKGYREFLLAQRSAEDRELQRFAGDAEASIAAFLNASVSEADRDRAASLRAGIAPFRRTALFSVGAAQSPISGLVPLPELERAYAALKTEIVKAADSANRDRIERVSGAFVWAQAMSVAALWFLAAILFALAWFMHERLIAPLEKLRSSVNGAAAGAMGETVWGIDRDDEVGGIARAAERLRQAALAAEKIRSAQSQERLADRAKSLEGGFARVANIAIEAQARIEAASERAAMASQAALEAAGLAREGSARFADRAEAALEFASVQTNAVLGALAAAVARLSDAASRVEKTPIERFADVPSGSAPPFGSLLTRLTQDGNRFISPNAAEREESEAVVEDLVADLEALERFARERKDIAGDKAVAMTATLIETIDRLNAVADRISASADDTQFRAAS